MSDGNAARSSTTTLRPARASVIAAALPAIREPTTTTSTCSTGVLATSAMTQSSRQPRAIDHGLRNPTVGGCASPGILPREGPAPIQGGSVPLLRRPRAGSLACGNGASGGSAMPIDIAPTPKRVSWAGAEGRRRHLHEFEHRAGDALARAARLRRRRPVGPRAGRREPRRPRHAPGRRRRDPARRHARRDRRPDRRRARWRAASSSSSFSGSARNSRTRSSASACAP